MNPNPLFFAQLDLPGTTQAWSRAGATTREIATVLAAICGLTLVLLVWAYFFRKKKRRVRLDRHTRGGERPAAASGSDNDSRRRKRRRRFASGMNPTRAQTGGLPAPRYEEAETVRIE